MKHLKSNSYIVNLKFYVTCYVHVHIAFICRPLKVLLKMIHFWYRHIIIKTEMIPYKTCNPFINFPKHE